MESIEFISQKTRQAYNIAAEKYFNLFHDELSKKEYDRNFLDLFLSFVPPGATVCDAGCGPSGHIGRYLSDRGVKIIGVDISERCVELASANNPGTDFLHGDIMNMSFPDNCFDGIVSCNSINNTPKEHVIKFFREFCRILKPEAYLLIVVNEGPGEGLIKEYIGTEADLYFSLFRESEILDYLSATGFELVFVETLNPDNSGPVYKKIYSIGRKPRA